MATKRTPSEILTDSLKEVENAQDVMIIIRNKDSSLYWHATTDSMYEKLGMLDVVRSALRNKAHTD